MTPQDALRIALNNGQIVVDAYLSDLTDTETLHRPGPGLNHIRWQLGHLIESEHRLIEQISPIPTPPLPAGFADRYSRELTGCDDPRHFDTLKELLELRNRQRAETLKALENCSAERLEEASGIEYAPTVAEVFALQQTHWLMHAGQWAIIRRQLGRPPLF